MYKLGGAKQLPVPDDKPRPLPQPPQEVATTKLVTDGHTLYMRNCMVCHGDRAISSSSTPDLRYMSPETHAKFDAIVRGGLYWNRGMVAFGEKLTQAETDAIHAYLIKRAHDVIEDKD